MLKRGKAQWSLSDDVETKSLGRLHPSAAAMSYVREALSEYAIPDFKLRYNGMKRFGGETAGSVRINEGVINIQAELKTQSGVRQYVDIPVIVHGGKMVYPQILVHEGIPRVMAKSTFEDLMAAGAITRADGSNRKHMYAPPGDKEGGALKTRTVSQGDWTSVQRHAAAEPSYLDPAERDRTGYLAPGQKVHTTHEVAITDRGGAVTKVPSGTEATVIRDMSGDGEWYYVDLEGYGLSPLGRASLK